MNQTNGTVAQQVAQAASEFQQQRTGHRPNAVTVVLSGETLVITLHGALSPAETAMAKSAAGAAKVQEFHRQLFATASETLREEIRRITGVAVREAIAEIETTTGTVVSMSHCYPYDLCSAPIQSPFPISFGGAAQGPTTLHVTNKGFITFNATTSYYPYDNEPLPTASFNTVVAPFWDYFAFGYYGFGSVLYQVLGEAPSRQLVIE